MTSTGGTKGQTPGRRDSDLSRDQPRDADNRRRRIARLTDSPYLSTGICLLAHAIYQTAAYVSVFLATKAGIAESITRLQRFSSKLRKSNHRPAFPQTFPHRSTVSATGILEAPSASPTLQPQKCRVCHRDYLAAASSRVPPACDACGPLPISRVLQAGLRRTKTGLPVRISFNDTATYVNRSRCNVNLANRSGRDSCCPPTYSFRPPGLQIPLCIVPFGCRKVGYVKRDPYLQSLTSNRRYPFLRPRDLWRLPPRIESGGTLLDAAARQTRHQTRHQLRLLRR